MKSSSLPCTGHPARRVTFRGRTTQEGFFSLLGVLNALPVASQDGGGSSCDALVKQRLWQGMKLPFPKGLCSAGGRALRRTFYSSFSLFHSTFYIVSQRNNQPTNQISSLFQPTHKQELYEISPGNLHSFQLSLPKCVNKHLD